MAEFFFDEIIVSPRVFDLLKCGSLEIPMSLAVLLCNVTEGGGFNVTSDERVPDAQLVFRYRGEFVATQADGRPASDLPG